MKTKTFADYLADRKISLVGSGIPAPVFSDILDAIMDDTKPKNETLQWLMDHRPDIVGYWINNQSERINNG